MIVISETFQIRTLKIRYGNTQAITNNAIPNPNLDLSSSKEPDIMNKTPKNPIITGRI